MTRKVTPTYTLLNQITLAAAANSVTFSNIPQSFGDLVLVFSGDGDNSGSNEIFGRFNGDTGGNYNRVYAGGNGSSTYSASNPNQAAMGLMAPANGRRINFIWNIMDYSAFDKHKTSLLRDNDAGFQVVMRAFRWANTAPVSSITTYTASGNFFAGSTFSLYGVVA